MRIFTIVFLALCGFGTIAFWVATWLNAGLREKIANPAFPVQAMPALAIADLAIYTVTALAAGYGLLTGASWAWPMLCVHAGSAMFASLYAGSFLYFGTGSVVAALATAPFVVLPAVLAWMLRPDAIG
jgi:hypothetical protein